MITRLAAVAAASAAVALAGDLRAQEASARSVRVAAELDAASPAAPRRFVLDLALSPGDRPFETRVEGWLAAVPPDDGHAEVTGTCAESRCALSAQMGQAELALTGDLAGPGAPDAGRFKLEAYDPEASREGAVRYAAAPAAVPGVGELAPRGAVTGRELSELLMWNGFATSFSNSDEDHPEGSDRRGLAEWQAAQGRPANGLIRVSDLRELRAGAEAERRRLGWTGVEGPGWSAGRPAALLPRESREGNERRFASADGSAVLAVAVDPPLTDDAWDQLVEEQTADRPERESHGYARVNDDMELSFVEKGRAHVVAYHHRPGGLARLVFSYPAEREDLGVLDALLHRSFVVADELPPQS